MKVIVDMSLVPIGVGTSVSEYIAACERILADSGLSPNIHGAGTEIEGEWPRVLDAVRRCHDTVHRMGAPRVHTVLKLSTRTDREESIERNVQSVTAKL